jgi:hypothetical protein
MNSNTYPTPNFLLSRIRQNRQLSPKQIYQFFYKEVQRKELETMKYMQIALDLIERKQQRINIVSSEDRDKIEFALRILSEVDAEIRQEVLHKNSSFLIDVERVLKFDLADSK